MRRCFPQALGPETKAPRARPKHTLWKPAKNSSCMAFSAESSCRQSVTKSSKVYLRESIAAEDGPAATPHPASGTNDKTLDAVSQEKSVHADTAVLTLQQSSSGGFGGGAAGGSGRGEGAFRRESLSFGSLRSTKVSWLPPRALPVRYSELGSRARAQGVSPGRVVGKLSIRV